MRRRLLRWVLSICVIGAVVWSGWWFVGSEGQKAGLEAWFEQQRKQGWQAEAASVEVSGYPDAFNLVAREMALADPATGWAWNAPEWKVDSTSTTPTRFTVTWPDVQTIAVPGAKADIRSEIMTSVLDVRPGPSMELRQLAGDIRALAITGEQGWKAGADEVSLDLFEKPADLGPPNSYDLEFSSTKLKLPKEVVAAIDPTGWLKPAVDRVTISGHAAFQEPIDRIALEEGRLALRAATIREAGFEWGDMRLVAKGAVQIDDRGFPVGKIEIDAREWRQMIRLAVSAGIVDSDTARSVTKGVEFLTVLTGGGDDLSLPIGLSGGKVRLGPFAIADAPRLAPPQL
ncbi:MAG: DUF2125 domain-containing protein [Paracoccaceae bacterium]